MQQIKKLCMPPLRSQRIPALESAHALAYAIKAASLLPQSYIMLIGLSGRGDKDVETLATYLEDKNDKKGI